MTFLKIISQMNDHVKRLLKDYCLLLKIIQLVLVCVCMNILSECEEYSIPLWLWIIYSINTTTYSIILMVLCLAHIFEKKKGVMGFTYFLLGIILYLTAGISGIIRYNVNIPNEDNDCNEQTLGIVFITCTLLMTLDVGLKIRLEKKAIASSRAAETTIETMQL